MQEIARKLAENTWGLLLARFVTPILMVVALWLGNQYLVRLDAAIALMGSRIDQQEKSLNALNQQMVALQTQSGFGTDSWRNMMTEVVTLRTRLDAAVSQIAAVTAKVDILISQLNASP